MGCAQACNVDQMGKRIISLAQREVIELYVAGSSSPFWEEQRKHSDLFRSSANSRVGRDRNEAHWQRLGPGQISKPTIFTVVFAKLYLSQLHPIAM